MSVVASTYKTGKNLNFKKTAPLKTIRTSIKTKNFSE